MIGFNLDRRLYDLCSCMPTIPGAVGAFRRAGLAQVGGISEDTLAEDTDITMALCRAGWRVVYEETRRAWTEAPATVRQLWRQRYRWSYGTMQAMWKHRHAVSSTARPGGSAGSACPASPLFQVLLPLLAPLIDLFLIYGLLFATRDPHAVGRGADRADPGRDVRVPARAGEAPAADLAAAATARLPPADVRRADPVGGPAMAGVRLRWQKLKRVGEFGALSAPPLELPGPAADAPTARRCERAAAHVATDRVPAAGNAGRIPAGSRWAGLRTAPTRTADVTRDATPAAFAIASDACASPRPVAGRTPQPPAFR